MAKIVELVAVTDIGVGSGDFWVKVIDYDGTVLLEKRGNNGDSFDLPSAPSHEGLAFQEWSASCPITDGKVIIDNKLNPHYIPNFKPGDTSFSVLFYYDIKNYCDTKDEV